MLKLTDRNMVANPVTLRPAFEADEAMKEVGGPAYLAQLTGSGAAVIGARDFAAQIYDLALLRALVGVGRDMVEGALDTRRPGRRRSAWLSGAPSSVPTRTPRYLVSA